jgi:hypothetical protein
MNWRNFIVTSTPHASAVEQADHNQKERSVSSGKEPQPLTDVIANEHGSALNSASSFTKDSFVSSDSFAPKEEKKKISSFMESNRQISTLRDMLTKQTEVGQDLVVETVANLSPVYWLSDGRIVGPGIVSAAARATEADGTESFWVCVEFEGSLRWVHNMLLRSKQAFDEQLRKEDGNNRGKKD